MVVNKKGKYIHHFQHIYIYICIPYFKQLNSHMETSPYRIRTHVLGTIIRVPFCPPPPKHTVVRSKKVLIP